MWGEFVYRTKLTADKHTGTLLTLVARGTFITGWALGTNGTLVALVTLVAFGTNLALNTRKSLISFLPTRTLRAPNLTSINPTFSGVGIEILVDDVRIIEFGAGGKFLGNR